MSAKVLKIDGNTMKQTDSKKRRAPRLSQYSEDQTDGYLLRGTDERGGSMYFFRVGVTGLNRRLFGPFRHKGHAIAAFDALLARVLQAMTDTENEDMEEALGNGGGQMIEVPGDLTVIKG